KIVSIVGASLLLMFFSSNLTLGAETLSKEEAEKLLNGNTAEGVNTKWDKKMIWYFQEGGTLRKQKPSGKRGRAEWSLDDKGELCHQDKHQDEPVCEPVVRRDDGKYEAMDGRWRFDKILPGNAHNL
ncbi:MAG: hypothetical protein PVF28_05505, partial [Thioalkalispiraceae bacterium]